MPDDNDQNPNDENLRVLRERAASADAATARAAELERKLLFADAGVKLGTPLGDLIFSGFKGETADQLKEYATSVGYQFAAAPTTDASAPAPRQQLDLSADRAAAQTRQVLAGGGTAPDPTSTPNPWDAGYEQFHKDRKAGVPLDDAGLALFDRVVVAGAQGDKRVIFDKQAWQQAAMAAAKNDATPG